MTFVGARRPAQPNYKIDSSHEILRSPQDHLSPSGAGTDDERGSEPQLKGQRPAKHLSAAQVALNACEIEGSKGSIKGKLKQAGWNDNFLARLPTQPIQRQMR